MTTHVLLVMDSTAKLLLALAEELKLDFDYQDIHDKDTPEEEFHHSIDDSNL